jgi:hypothetical protein
MILTDWCCLQRFQGTALCFVAGNRLSGAHLYWPSPGSGLLHGVFDFVGGV